MYTFVVGAILFVCLFGGAMRGMVLGAVLPEHHLSADSMDAITLSTAIVATLSALALGLLVASAKTSFDTADTQLRTAVARTVVLDRVLVHYGPEAQDARVQLRQMVEAELKQFWGEGRTGDANPDADGANAGIETVQDELRALTPRTEAQRWLLARALQVQRRRR
jgi:hypothetical protein